ncbi:MAG: ComEC/Rec2 family competence protein, partial [Planctomycetota bacterium]
MIGISLLFFVLGGLLSLREPPKESVQTYEKIWRGELVRISGVIEGVFLPKKYESPWEEDKIRESSSGWFKVTRFYLDDKAVEVDERVFLSVGDRYPFFRGQEIEAIGQLYTVQNQLRFKVRHSTGILNASSPSCLMSFLMNYQQKILKIWEEHFSEDQNALFRMLIFGEKRQDEFLLWFYRAGNAHLLAISGLHLTLLLCFLAYGLKLFRIHRRWIQFILGTFVLVGLFLLVQFGPSMSRTALMFLLVFLGTLLGRGIDSLNVSAIVFMGMLAWEPSILWNVGFQLTFMAFFAILLIASKRDQFFPPDLAALFQKPSLWKRIFRLYLAGVFFSLAIQSVTTPILMAHFHQFYLWEALTGPFFVLPFQFVLFGLFGMILGAAIFPEILMDYYCVGLHFVTELFLAMVRFLGSLPGNHQLVASRPGWVYLIYFIPLILTV